ncbi:MAG: aminoacyl-tRNA hydrolase [Candidatus Binatia bacterium]
MKIVMGLGNPGKRYERVRHSLGFMVVDRFASEKEVAVKERKYRSLIGSCQVGREKILLVKPQTYMNRSGEAVRCLFRYLPVRPQDLVVVHDDLDLPFGHIRIRARGGPGGHRGILSILDALGEQGFFRVRVGIGRPPPGVDPSDYVLAPFPPGETALVDQVALRAAGAVDSLLGEGSHRAMEKFNRAN